MKFVTHNEEAIDICGTSLKGYLRDVSYHRLVVLFGRPNESDGEKSDAEWDIRFEDGTVCTIYNWKNGKNYCGKDGLALRDITEWHVGAKKELDVTLVVDAIIEGVAA